MSERPDCDICGEPATTEDGIIGAYICDKDTCFQAAWDRAWGR